MLPVYQVVTTEGPLFCLSWCKRKRWLLVGGNAQLHIYSVSSCPAITRANLKCYLQFTCTAAEQQSLAEHCTSSLNLMQTSSMNVVAKDFKGPPLAASMHATVSSEPVYNSVNIAANFDNGLHARQAADSSK